MSVNAFAPVLTVNGYHLATSRVLGVVSVALLAPWDAAYSGYPRIAEANAYVSADADGMALDLYYSLLDACNAGAARDLPYSPAFTRALLATCYRVADAVAVA